MTPQESTSAPTDSGPQSIGPRSLSRSEPSWPSRFRAAPVSIGLIALCLGAFVASLVVCVGRSHDPIAVLMGSVLHLNGCEDPLITFGALSLPHVWLDGSWWRVISAGLLHGSWLHLILNVWSLWVVGEWVESTWGSPRTAVLFALSSVGGSLASTAWVEAPLVVGASAGILGMAGALLVGRLWGGPQVRAALRPVSAGILGAWLAALIGLGYWVPMIAQAGHLGGLAVGVGLGMAWAQRGWMVALIGRAAVVIGLAGLAVLARSPMEREGYYEFLGYEYLHRDRGGEAAGAFEKALARAPDKVELANAVAYGFATAGIELERAEELVRRALAVEPENADYLDTLGWIYCRRGKVDDGLEMLGRASEASEGVVEEIERHRVECAGVGGML